MIKLGKLTLNGTPRIAVGFNDRVPSQAILDVKDFGLDVVELRIDQYSSFEVSHVLNEVKKFKNFPSIATIRSEKEGGDWNLSESKRLDLFKAVIPHVDAIDIELSTVSILKQVIKEAHAKKKLVIVSYHNFDRTPNFKTLNQIVYKAKALRRI